MKGAQRTARLSKKVSLFCLSIAIWSLGPDAGAVNCTLTSQLDSQTVASEGNAVLNAIDNAYNKLVESGAFNGGKIQADASSVLSPFLQDRDYCRLKEVMQSSGIRLDLQTTSLGTMHDKIFNVEGGKLITVGSWFFHRSYSVDIKLVVKASGENVTVASYSLVISSFGL